jgi:RNA-directed DNA polymerase
MKVRYRKGAATHSGPESCGAGREAVAEALTGEAAGQPLSSEIETSGAPTLLSYAEGKTEGGVIREPSEGSTRSETLSMWRNPSHRNWEASSEPGMPGMSGKAERRKPGANADEKSDARIVPRKNPNNGNGSIPLPAEDLEGRRVAKRNVAHPPAPRTQSRTGAAMGLHGVRKATRKGRVVRFTALMDHIAPQLLAESFMDLKRSAAAGVDCVTWRDYENGLDNKIAALWDAVQSGRRRALSSRRVFISESRGSQRPLGGAALEDKIVQQAVVTVSTAIYEADFLGFSYGFRPGRSQHDAL